MYYAPDNISCAADAKVSEYFQTAASIARKLDEVYGDKSIGYIATQQLHTAVDTGLPLNYNDMVAYAVELDDEFDLTTIGEGFEEKAKFYEAFERAGIDSDQIGEVHILDGSATFMGLNFTFNNRNELVLGDA